MLKLLVTVMHVAFPSLNLCMIVLIIFVCLKSHVLLWGPLLRALGSNSCPMNLISWNVRGLGRPVKRFLVKDFLYLHSVDICCL